VPKHGISTACACNYTYIGLERQNLVNRINEREFDQHSSEVLHAVA